MHCHCLPEIDVGTKDMEECIAMLNQVDENGIWRIIKTQHFYQCRGNIKKDKVKKKEKTCKK